MAPAANALLKLNQQGPRASNPSQGPCACCLIKSALFTYIHTYIHACIHVVVTRLTVLTNDVGRKNNKAGLFRNNANPPVAFLWGPEQLTTDHRKQTK